MVFSGKDMVKNRLLALALVGLVGVIVALTFWRVQQPQLLSDEHLQNHGVYILPTARELRSFELTDHNQQPFTPQRLLQRWSLVFFGFTSCPDICPTTMAQMGRNWDNIKAALPDDAQVQMIMATVDPQIDSPEVLAKYVPAFHSDFVGVTGGVKTLYRLSAGLGLPFMPLAMDDSAAHHSDMGHGDSAHGDMKHGNSAHKGMNHRQVEHSANVAIVNPCGHYVGFVRSPVDAGLLPTVFATLARRPLACRSL